MYMVSKNFSVVCLSVSLFVRLSTNVILIITRLANKRGLKKLGLKVT